MPWDCCVTPRVRRSAFCNLGIEQKDIFGRLRGPERHVFYKYSVATQRRSDGGYTGGLLQPAENETKGKQKMPVTVTLAVLYIRLYDWPLSGKNVSFLVQHIFHPREIQFRVRQRRITCWKIGEGIELRRYGHGITDGHVAPETPHGIVGEPRFHATRCRFTDRQVGIRRCTQG